MTRAEANGRYPPLSRLSQRPLLGSARRLPPGRHATAPSSNLQARLLPSLQCEVANGPVVITPSVGTSADGSGGTEDAPLH